jgi:signal transduction histidine kinase
MHSRAAEATVTLEFNAESIKIAVHDNGKGFTLPKRINALASKGKVGLIGIEERMRSIKGTCHIQSKPGQGTSISVEFKV